MQHRAMLCGRSAVRTGLLRGIFASYIRLEPMSAISEFNANIDASDRLVAMYRELRGKRALGARGVLTAINQDLLWLPRSAVVASISALDTYVHAVVKARLPTVFGKAVPPPAALCEQLAQLITIKNGAAFKEALPLLTAADTIAGLLAKLDEKFLRFQSFQAPEKIIEAFRLIGHDAIFEAVSDLWPGPNTTAEHLKRRLSGYVQRRNQIAHEGDREPGGAARSMQPEYAIACQTFVSNLALRLNQAVYGV